MLRGTSRETQPLAVQPLYGLHRLEFQLHGGFIKANYHCQLLELTLSASTARRLKNLQNQAKALNMTLVPAQ